MVNSALNSTELSSEVAKDLALKCINQVKTYLENLNSSEYSLDMETSIIALDELKSRLTSKSNPITHFRQSDILIITAVEQIIRSKEEISSKLRNFWMAHQKMASLADSQKKKYQPQRFFDENRTKILEVDKRYQNLTDIISKDETDDIKRAYAIFYIHILKTEVIEFSFIEQFKILLKEFNLIQKYDAEDIFSATNKVRKGNEWRTEARAIRDALSHNKYALEINNSSWKVIFDNHDHGYEFNKTFTNSEFYKYLNNTDKIYRGTMMLLNAFIAMILIHQHCIDKI